MQKLLVLGASGFIGRNMAEHFSQLNGFKVYGTYFNSKPYSGGNIELTKVDLTRAEEVEEIIAGKDIVIQAAAVTSGVFDIVNNPHYHIADNAVINSLVFRAAYHHQVSHVINFSCSILYPSREGAWREEEYDPNFELHPKYFGGAWNKIYFEKIAQFYSGLGRNRHTVLRHSNNYGPYDKYDLQKSHVFGATITKVMEAEGQSVVVWGSGEEARDLLYVSDLCRAAQLAIEKQQNAFELYNIGAGETISVKDLTQKIIDHSLKKLTIEYDLTKPSIKTALSLDSGKALRELGWAPQISLDEGIKLTLNWYRENDTNVAV